MRTLIIRLISRVFIEPGLLYLAQFSTHDGGMVQVNKFGPTAQLMIVQTGSAQPQQPLPETDPIGVGLVLRVTKDATQPGVATMVALSPLPPGLPPRFTLVADFFLPQEIGGPWADGVQWAATVGMRNGDDPDVATFKLAGAAHQIRNLSGDPNPGTARIALGAGTGPTDGTISPDPTNELVPSPEAYPDERRDFRLETDIYLDRRQGWSRLRTPGHVWTQRSWLFDTNKFPQITGIGFGQAFRSGAGTATVTATAFRIYALDIWRWLGLALLGLLSNEATL
jgi:hypothetical protein